MVLVLVSGLSCGLPAREFGVSAVEVDCVEGHLVAFTEIEGEIDVGKGQDKVWECGLKSPPKSTAMNWQGEQWYQMSVSRGLSWQSTVGAGQKA